MSGTWLQVLHMLRGCPSPGSAFRLDARSDAFEVKPGVHVPHLSPACLCNVLLTWARTGTTAYRSERVNLLFPVHHGKQRSSPSYQDG